MSPDFPYTFSGFPDAAIFFDNHASPSDLHMHLRLCHYGSRHFPITNFLVITNHELFYLLYTDMIIFNPYSYSFVSAQGQGVQAGS